MRARNVAERIDHGEHDKAEGERNARVRDSAIADRVNNDGARARKDEGERSKNFRAKLFHASSRYAAHFRAPGFDASFDFVTRFFKARSMEVRHASMQPDWFDCAGNAPPTLRPEFYE
jgi:hypothetical protein